MKIDPNTGALLGSLAGAAIGALAEVSRRAIADALRQTADRVERGDIVSDDEIDKLSRSLDRVRRGMEQRRKKG